MKFLRALSPRVRASRKNSSASFSFRRRFRRRRSFLRQAFFVFLGVALMAAGLLLAMQRTNAFRIREIRVEGTRFLDAGAIQVRSSDLVHAPVFGPLRGNLIFLPKKRVEETLRKEFPRIEKVDIARDVLHRDIRILVVERAQAGIYCSAKPNIPPPAGNTPQERPAIVVGPCFLIDRNGVVFAEAPQTEGGLILSVIAVRADAPQALGVQVMDSGHFAVIEKLWNDFPQETRVSITRMLDEGEGILRIQTTEGWEALFDLTRAPDEQLVALRELLAKELPATKRMGITTIDLRVPGKVYYY